MDDRNAARGHRLRLLRIAWHQTQEQILPGARVAIGHVERGINKCTSARIVGAYTELTGTTQMEFRAYADGLQSLEWLVTKARHKPPAGWQRRVRDEQAKSAAPDGPETNDLGAFSSQGTPGVVLTLDAEMQRLSDTVRRAAQAAAILEGVPLEQAIRAATKVVAHLPAELDRPELVDHWLRKIRDQILLANSGTYSRAGNGS